jgi:hypothetical protein
MRRAGALTLTRRSPVWGCSSICSLGGGAGGCLSNSAWDLVEQFGDRKSPTITSAALLVM